MPSCKGKGDRFLNEPHYSSPGVDKWSGKLAFLYDGREILLNNNDAAALSVWALNFIGDNIRRFSSFAESDIYVIARGGFRCFRRYCYFLLYIYRRVVNGLCKNCNDLRWENEVNAGNWISAVSILNARIYNTYRGRMNFIKWLY